MKSMACYRRSLLRALFFSRVIGLIIGVALCFCCITCKQKEAAAPAPTEPAQVRLGGEKRTNDVTRFNDSDDLESDFLNPPAYAQPRICWRWLEGNISKEGIRNDLTEMKKVGIRGAVIYDTDSSSYDQVERTKPGPGFMSQAWRDLFRYACEVADSLDMEISLNLGSRWHNGGPWITPELSSKKLVWSQIDVDGGRRIQTKLNLPEGLLTRPGSDELYYVPVAVLAVRLDEDNMYTAPLERFKIKALHTIHDIPEISGLGYHWEAFIKEEESYDDDFNTRLSDIYDISHKTDAEGNLSWEAPEGRFRIFRFVYTGTGLQVSSSGTEGLTMDFMSAEAMDVHFDHSATVLLKDMQGKHCESWKYLQDNCWEPDAANWTESLPREFKKTNGYDITKYFPVITGLIVENRDVSNRFLYDFRRTISDLICKNHYGRFKALARQYRLSIHPESGGPHPAPIDALQNLGQNDVPMGEFWLRATTHRIRPEERFFIKQAASAAHIYNRRFVAAQGPMSIGPMWEEDFRYMKPTLDRAYCEGMNRVMLHCFTHSPASAGKPGNAYFTGTCFNTNVTWWKQSKAFLTWTARNSMMLAQGKPVSDVCIYYGDNTPNQAYLKHLIPGLGEGYDYDITNTEVILNRMSVRNGRIVLPDGVSYQVLMLPDRKGIKAEVLTKIKELVRAGATVVGPKPRTSVGLRNYPAVVKQIQEDADSVWGKRFTSEHRFGKGRVVWGKPLRTILQEAGVAPDMEYKSRRYGTYIDYIHRTRQDAEIYYVVNRREQPEWVTLTFRVKKMQPEVWDPVDGSHTTQRIFTVEEDSRITLPVFLEPYGSRFIVFRKPVTGTYFTELSRNGVSLFPRLPAHTFSSAPVVTLPDGSFYFLSGKKYELKKHTGRKITLYNYETETMVIRTPWNVSFDPAWGGPEKTTFERLISWPHHPDKGIRYYSGAAVYENRFTLTPQQRRRNRVILTLGEVYHVAEVTINGRSAGIWWNAPFEKDVSEFVKSGVNTLEVKVVNLWPNRLIGDLQLPEEERFTRTNVRKFTKDAPLLPSGLLGPVGLTFRPVKKP